MLAITRQLLLGHLLEIRELVDAYARRDAFVPDVLRWLQRTESTLQRLRSPLSSLVATQRAQILAVGDGLSEPTVVRVGRSARRTERAVTAIALRHIEEALRTRLMEIDHKLEDAREKMVSFLAAASKNVAIPPPTGDRTAWLHATWRALGAGRETGALHTYLDALLTSTDRDYLLDDVLSNLLEKATECDPQKSGAPFPTGKPRTRKPREHDARRR